MVCLKVKAIKCMRDMVFATKEIFVVEVSVPGAVVSVKIQIFCEVVFQFYQFGIVVFADCFFRAEKFLVSILLMSL